MESELGFSIEEKKFIIGKLKKKSKKSSHNFDNICHCENDILKYFLFENILK
jgi:hypothetical protein